MMYDLGLTERKATVHVLRLNYFIFSGNYRLLLCLPQSNCNTQLCPKHNLKISPARICQLFLWTGQ